MQSHILIHQGIHSFYSWEKYRLCQKSLKISHWFRLIKIHRQGLMFLKICIHPAAWFACKTAENWSQSSVQMISFKLCPAWSRTLLGLEQCVCVCVYVCVCVCVCLNSEHMYSQNNLFSRTSSLKYGVQRIFHLHSYTCFQTHTLWTYYISHTQTDSILYQLQYTLFPSLTHTGTGETAAAAKLHFLSTDKDR